MKIDIPEGTTHIWTYGMENPIQENWIGYWTRLHFYKKIGKQWWVYSPITNWRLSGNPLEWFKKEREEGLFITLNQWRKRNDLLPNSP